MIVPVRVEAPSVHVVQGTPENIVEIHDVLNVSGHDVTILLSSSRATIFAKELLRAASLDSENPDWAVVHCFKTKADAALFVRWFRKESSSGGEALIYNTRDLAL